MNSVHNNTIFLAWNSHSTRTRSLSKNLEIPLFEINYYKRNRNLFIVVLKYLLATQRTLFLIIKENPAIVFVQNPPIILPFLIGIFSFFKKYQFIVDTHTGVFDRPRWSKFLWMYKFISRKALLNILHNRPLAKRVENWGARTLTLGDIPFTLKSNLQYQFDHQNNIAVVNSFSADEPIEEIMNAAKQLSNIQFYITGNIDNADRELIRRSLENVIFTGFLPEQEYIGLLAGSDMVISLTTNNFTMQNGVYEAIELERPVITSDWPVLRESYKSGAVFVNNTAYDIVLGIKKIYQDYTDYCAQIKQLKSEIHSKWENNVILLNRIMSNNNYYQ